ncbi:MAG: 3-deoxy-manno-octulosonate cytidylyltransferase [Candidatus Omnitrophica bacterium]|nr:3-deoxy-manno-octulosonate cytidylyltransferase [Candidatus Omnitrophota bacterium]
MTTIGIIPVRMGSSRFPGKPLAKICGITMVEHVYRRSALSKNLDDVYVATCDDDIKEAVEAFGGKVIMTKDTHERCSDRVAEALEKIEEQLGKEVDVVAMIQGDEPMIFPEMLDEGIAPFAHDPEVVVTNLMAPLKSKEEHEDPNEVKVVVDLNNNALYFSREAIPSRKKGVEEVPMLKQVCIISFRRDFLLKYQSLEPTALEKIESVDMMRVLEHGYKVKMVPTSHETYSVDTLEDLRKVEELMKHDVLMKEYEK